jgi:alkyl hydroperoxide reductase subunit D
MDGAAEAPLERLRGAIPPPARDIGLNLHSVLTGTTLSAAQTWGVALACAFVGPSAALRQGLLEAARGALDADTFERVVDDAQAAAALMAMNNVFYRFRHFVKKETYAHRPARLRMARLAQPKTDKATFELLCLAVSAVHGCEVCVSSHEHAVIEGGLTEEHVHDAVRIAATVRGAEVALSL